VLFLHGDPKRIFTLYEHGFFYPLDAVFLLIGFGALFTTNKRVLKLLAALILIAPIPTLASNEWTSYASRSYLLQPLLLILIGTGIAYAFKAIRLRNIFSIGIIIFYGISYAYFSSVYFLRNPIANSESSNVSARIMTLYANHEISQGKNIIVISDNPETPLKQYTFYTNGFTRSNAHQYANMFTDKKFELGKFLTVACITPDDIPENTTLIIEGNPVCKTIPRVGHQFVIPLLADAGTVYTIYQGETCSHQKLERFPHDIAFSDFSLEKLPEQRFCEKFIIQY
jgi:hypothetical protein